MKNLESFLKKFRNKSIVIGFSGGNDSSCLAFITKKILKQVNLAFVKTELITEEAVNLAKKNAKILNLDLKIFEIEILNHSEIRNNSKLRCYFCKKFIYTCIKKNYPDAVILDGTNFSDTFSYRPGIKALIELGIISPFKECKISKNEIISYIKQHKKELLSSLSPCIAVKFDYGTDLFSIIKNSKSKIQNLII